VRGRRDNDPPPGGPRLTAGKGWRNSVNDQLSFDDDLLQGRLDGRLTGEQSARLEARLAVSPALRERAEQLDALAEALALVKATDPPPALEPRVMARIQPNIESISGRRATVATQEAGMSQARHAQKVIWGLAAAAVIILGVWFATGTPDVGGPAAGTVGVAKRYTAPQIADDDVKLDASTQTIQAFLDSEAFGRVMADPEAVALLGDAAVRAAIGARAAKHETTPSPIANASIAAVIDDPSFVVLVTNPAFETSWNDAARKSVEMNSALEKSRLGGNLAINSGLGAAVKSNLDQGAAVKGNLYQGAAVKGNLDRGAAVKGNLGHGATGINSSLDQNAALKSRLEPSATGVSGLGTRATGVDSQLRSQLDGGLGAQLRAQLKVGLESQLQAAVKNGLNGGLSGRLGQRSSQ
jgi:hypothetical protein